MRMTKSPPLADVSPEAAVQPAARQGANAGGLPWLQELDMLRRVEQPDRRVVSGRAGPKIHVVSDFGRLTDPQPSRTPEQDQRDGRPPGSAVPCLGHGRHTL